MRYLAGLREFWQTEMAASVLARRMVALSEVKFVRYQLSSIWRGEKERRQRLELGV